MEAEVVVVRLKEGPCPEGATCISIGWVELRKNVVVPDGDYLVVMSPVVADVVNLAELKKRFKCIICVGPSTAERVGGCVVPREFTSFGIARLLKEMAPGRVVVLRSSAGNEVLRSLMPEVIEVPVYDIYIDEGKLKEATRLIESAKTVVLTSSTVAEAVARRADLGGKVVVAIGRVTSEKLKELGVRHIVAEESTIKNAVWTALNALRRGAK
ncbi:hypothetical protein PAE0589 [Pyrobaculum aerophilum str. IM2]|uniref:Tetrapyrrole biosynthesis uroporphyrinogen III synthase domain-containing protein n=1 Tax=Pyrobaculum aerophilum (strain ATCC 51768 / DSM 7523 / JCM 9630 / CIP 104966 / NBRC 100827 / IM2) TaxID=178306 RepID=Q8ZYW3_PYRAE|nr:uroporphyrinogen-III synthase [Pyrobaculum aerophilum]AAL62880.1 hypothetical protein PAE0589 [Pyrobaculum aerophilum str. IM2]